MVKKILFPLSVILFIAGCGSVSEEKVVKDTLESINEVNNYELEIITGVQGNGNESEEVYLMEIDVENSQGYITLESDSEIPEATSVEMYYDHENAYERTQEGEWFASRMSVEDMHSMFFADYGVIVQVLELMESKEETVFEEAADSHVFSYQTSNEEEVTAFMDEWGFDSEDPIDEIAVDYQVDEQTYFLEKVHLELMINDEDGNQQAKITHELHYKNINELPGIEIPDGIEDE